MSLSMLIQLSFPCLSSCCLCCSGSSHYHSKLQQRKKEKWEHEALCNYRAMMECATGRRFFLLWFSWRKRSLMTPIWQTFVANYRRRTHIFSSSRVSDTRTSYHSPNKSNALWSWDVESENWNLKFDLFFESWWKNSFCLCVQRWDLWGL